MEGDIYISQAKKKSEKEYIIDGKDFSFLFDGLRCLSLLTRTSTNFLFGLVNGRPSTPGLEESHEIFSLRADPPKKES